MMDLFDKGWIYVSFKTHPHCLRKLFTLSVILISIYLLVK